MKKNIFYLFSFCLFSNYSFVQSAFCYSTKAEQRFELDANSSVFKNDESVAIEKIDSESICDEIFSKKSEEKIEGEVSENRFLNEANTYPSNTQKANASKVKINFWTIFKLLLKMSYAPKSLVTVKSYSGSFSQSFRSNFQENFKKNTIISLLPDNESIIPLGKSDIKELKILKKSSKNNLNNLKPFLKTIIDKPSCVDILNKNKELLEKYIANRETEEQFRAEIQPKINQKLVKDMLYKSQNLNRFRKYDWKLNHKISLKTIQKIISNSNSKNILLLAHAADDGRIVDSGGNFLPEGFFESISSEIESLSLFLCHPVKVIRYYHLDELSIRKGFKIYYPEMDPVLQKLIGSSTLSQTFPGFLDKLAKFTLETSDDNHVSLSQGNFKKNQQSIFSNKEACSLNFQYRNLTKEYEVFLNQKLIGFTEGDLANPDIFYFDCEILKKENVLIIQSETGGKETENYSIEDEIIKRESFSFNESFLSVETIYPESREIHSKPTLFRVKHFLSGSGGYLSSKGISQ